MLLFCVYYILFIHYVSDVLAIEKYDVVVSGKLSFPSETIDKLKNEISYMSSSDRKSVSDKMYHKMMDLTAKQIRAMRNKNRKDIKNYIQHLIFRAANKITSEAKYFKSELQSHKDISKIIYNANNKYSLTFQNYSENLLKQVNLVYDIDKEFIILDLIESADQLLHDECKIILSVIQNSSLNSGYKAYQAKVISLLEALYKNLVESKKDEMKYACEYFQICRTFPAYSDYTADFIRDILKLSDVRLNYFLIHIKLLVKEQVNFFNAALTTKITIKLGNYLETLFNGDIVKVRNNLIALREILTQRHKIARLKNTDIIKSRSISILIAIINKAFDRSDDDILSILFDNSIKALRNWANMKIHDITSVLGSFVRYFIDCIKYNWKPETMEEVKTLIEIILQGNATNEQVYEYLFTKGSIYVNTKPENDINVSL